jgi:hypothetical protein
MTIITDPTTIDRVRVRALRGMLKLQSVGIGRRGRSALSIIRAEFPAIKSRTAKGALAEFDAMHPDGSTYGRPL